MSRNRPPLSLLFTICFRSHSYNFTFPLYVLILLVVQFIQLFPVAILSHIFSLFSHGILGVVFTQKCTSATILGLPTIEGTQRDLHTSKNTSQEHATAVVDVERRKKSWEASSYSSCSSSASPPGTRRSEWRGGAPASSPRSAPPPLSPSPPALRLLFPFLPEACDSFITFECIRKVWMLLCVHERVCMCVWVGEGGSGRASGREVVCCSGGGWWGGESGCVLCGGGADVALKCVCVHPYTCNAAFNSGGHVPVDTCTCVQAPKNYPRMSP